jgi:hypothetical protein
MEVESVTLSHKTLGLRKGEKLKLIATILPADAEADSPVSWETTDESIVTVDQEGNVEAIADGDVEITATAGKKSAKCPVNVAMRPRSGDFFYSDGTYSQNLDATKTPIGLVFWTGNPAQEDPVLAKDFPGCTHGLVVSLDEDKADWQTNFAAYDGHVARWITQNTDFISTAAENDWVHRILGYNNTKAYEAFNAAPENSAWKVNIAERAVEYRTKVAVPENASDWYIPSLVEMALMCIGDFDDNIFYVRGTANRDKLIPKFALLGNAAAPMGELDMFWTSTENNLSVVHGVWLFKFYLGELEATSSRKSSIFKNRYVLAF